MPKPERPRNQRKPAPKLQRWLDLLAALLRRHYPTSYADLADEVPAYRAPAGRRDQTLRRMFERDKDELRASGIPIQTILTAEGEVAGYRLARTDFYLPYLSVASQGRSTRSRTSDREGYRALSRLSFEAEELAAVVDAARRVEVLGDPLLSADAASALRKLSFDLPLEGVAADPAVATPPVPAVDAALFEQLTGALERRKRVSFSYRSIAAGRAATRMVCPYGLFFLSRHWYLAGPEPGDPLVKNYRLSRMSAVRMDPGRSGTPDFTIPADFSLRDHARSRQAWELGAGEEEIAIVWFSGRSGAVAAARKLGEAIPGEADLRCFRVRRPDVFARWLLSFGGEAIPLEPAALKDAAADLARQTLALYGEA